MERKTYLLFLSLFLILYSIGYTQEPIYKNFGVDEGLPSSQVFDIYQDKQGYIIFATDKGISRYNGYEFKNYGSENGLPGNVILRFYPQQNDQIWGYTFHTKSLFFFNERFNGFTTYKHNELLQKELGRSGIIKSLYIDKENTVHIGGTGINGIILIKDNGKIERKYTNKEYSRSKEANKYFNLNNSVDGNTFCFTSMLIKDTDNPFFIKGYFNPHIEALWLKNNKKAVINNGKFIRILSRKNKTITIKKSYTPIGIKKIDSSNFFLGYYFGGGKIISDKGEVVREYLKDKSVTNFLKDHEGGYWLTTQNSGVYYIKRPGISILKEKKKHNHINSLVKKNNELLIGYKDGGYSKLNVLREFKNLTKPSKYPDPTIVEYDSISNKTYVYGAHGLEINNTLFGKKYTIKLSEPTKNGVIFGSSPSGFYEMNNKNHKFPWRVQDVSIWEKDTLVATPLGVFQKNKNKIIPLSKKTNLLSYRSDDIDIAFNEKKFFIATQGIGVVVYGDTIYNISTKDGLTSNSINEIKVENDSVIWACTNKGLNRITFKKNTFKVTSINKETGLLSNEIEDIEIINDTLFIGTKEGLCLLPKKELDHKEQKNFYLKIKDIKVNDITYDKDKLLELSYNQNKITFSVEGIFYAGENLEYQYRLKGVDTKWSSTKNRNISFPNLKSGKYTFQVKACLKDKCSKVNHLEYSFTIRSAFWKTGWFLGVCLMGFAWILYNFFKIRVLTYNKDVVREFIRLLIRRLNLNEKYLEVRMNGEDLKILSNTILYVKSSGNYLDIITLDKKYTVRCKIGDFIRLTPDSLEFLRIHRSYIIRIDKVTGKSKKSVTIGNETFPVGETYLSQLKKIHF
ncbi:ligand-binding sensor domain-containing protein [Tenacibaculum sp. nBUS_03]|uniref:ligand-binding sensor domain-containing protein n=1 Tax=Tenacibaculum sp. nBUS_03 TaxID=3395320 RepID=UPI003EBB451D